MTRFEQLQAELAEVQAELRAYDEMSAELLEQIDERFHQEHVALIESFKRRDTNHVE